MKKIVVMLATVLSIYCLIGCGSNDTSGEASNDSQQESTVKEEDGDIVNNEASSDVTEPTAESTSDATIEEATTVVYEGIDMESTLSGEEWIATFIDIITEPKVVVFSDETGRKEIIEKDGVVKCNPDVDMIAVYLAEGTTVVNYEGISVDEAYNYEHCKIFKLNAEKVRKFGRQSAAINVEFNGEELALTFDFKPE